MSSPELVIYPVQLYCRVHFAPGSFDTQPNVAGLVDSFSGSYTDRSEDPCNDVYTDDSSQSGSKRLAILSQKVNKVHFDNLIGVFSSP